MLERDLSKRLILFTVSIMRCAEKYSTHRALQPVLNQLIRCAGSVGANITEAQGSSSRKDFVNFFHIALKSAEETRYWLDVLEEHGAVSKEEIGPMREEASSFIRILTASINTAKKKTRPA